MRLVCAILLLCTSLNARTKASNVVSEAWQAVSRTYIEMPSQRAAWTKARVRFAEKQYASADDEHEAIRQMVMTLGNSRLQWLSAQDIASILPEFSGPPPKLGLAFLSFEFLPGKKRIVAPLWQSPASAAGIRTGDLLLDVNGVDVQAMSSGELVRVLEAAGHRPAHIVLNRGGERVTAATQPDPTFQTFLLWRVERRNGKKIGHLVIREFTAKMLEELPTILKSSESVHGVHEYELDVRDNPGGLLDAVREVAAYFISGKGFVCHRTASGERRCEATPSRSEITAPVTVLVNKGTASAAEIFAAGFQRTGRGKVVGCRTFGHGYGGQFVKLSDGSALLIPDTSYLDAKDQPIEGRGIVPDVVTCP